MVFSGCSTTQKYWSHKTKDAQAHARDITQCESLTYRPAPQRTYNGQGTNSGLSNIQGLISQNKDQINEIFHMARQKLNTERCMFGYGWTLKEKQNNDK